MRDTAKLIAGLALAALAVTAARAQDRLPADVHPETRNRLPPPAVEAESAVAGIRAHGTGGVPRWEFAHGRAMSELAILAVARELDQPYEWSLHEIEALAVGLEPRIIDIVRNRGPLDGLSEMERVLIQLGRELVGDHTVSAETYARAERVLGRANLVDIVGLMGNYVSTGLLLTAFNQQMPPGWPQFLPLPFTPPDDIRADSRSRLPYIRDEIRNGVATPSLYGRQLAPEATGPGQIRRYISGLESLEANVGRRLVRLARLIASRELDDAYQWTLNERAAAADGPERQVIDVVRRRAAVAGLAERDAVLIEFGRELIGANTVTAATYARARDVFGQSNLVDFVNLMAQHADDAMLLIAFQQHLPAGQVALLPIP